MAETITLTVPDGFTQDFARTQGWTPAEPETAVMATRRSIRKMVVQNVRAYRVNAAMETAREGVESTFGDP